MDVANEKAPKIFRDDKVPKNWPVWEMRMTSKESDEAPTIACYSSGNQGSSSNIVFEFRPKNKGYAIEILRGDFGFPPSNSFYRLDYECKGKKCSARNFVYVRSALEQAYFARDPDELKHKCTDPSMFFKQRVL